MADDDIIKVGNRVRRASWPNNHPGVVISAVGRDRFLAVGCVTDYEDVWDVDTAWELVPEPPKRYVVEHRAPKRGERYFYKQGIHKFSDHSPDSDGDVRAVIVEEL